MFILKYSLLLVFSALLVSCGGDAKSGETTAANNINGEDQDEAKAEQITQVAMQNVEETKYHEYKDPNNGITQIRYPIPKSWQVNDANAPIYVEGPNNLKVYKEEISSYAWSNDPQMQQTMQMSGHVMGRPVSTQQILDQVIQPNAQQQGYELLKSYYVPEVAGFYKKLFHAMANTGSQRSIETLATEWNTGKGTKAMILLVKWQTTQQQAVMWTIQTVELESDPEYFEEAVDAYLYSYANAQLNPQWIQFKNGQLRDNLRRNDEYWTEATRQSAAAHRQRINAIEARGNTAKSIGDTYSDILDISHKGYLNRSNINDAGHAKSVRAASGTTMIGNHETREHYTVPTGSDYYWVSEEGTYFGTDNALFDPNTDQRMNDKNWTKFAKEN